MVTASNVTVCTERANPIHCTVVLETILYPINNRSNILPRSINAVSTFRLERPLTLFGNKYDVVYVSRIGSNPFELVFRSQATDC